VSQPSKERIKLGRLAFQRVLQGKNRDDVLAYLRTLVPASVDLNQISRDQHCAIEGKRQLIVHFENLACEGLVSDNKTETQTEANEDE
tara:strand:+ start:2707 stop:2970 length:264 start_codon:yes stop_codon:yes gene_type:complete